MRDKPLILIIDDAREIVRGIGLRLRAAGYDVLTAFDGKTGLESAIEACPDAIVLDIRMPVMDGLTMLRQLRQHDRVGATPAIVLSANIAEQARSQAFQLGAKFFLEKPYDGATLVSAVQSALVADPGEPAASAVY